MFIDGRRVATLGYGRNFKGVLPAGMHLVTVQQTPHLNDAYPYSQQWIRLRPGVRPTESPSSQARRMEPVNSWKKALPFR